MKAILVCSLTATLSLLANSCCPTGDGAVDRPPAKDAGGPMVRRDALCKALNEYWKQRSSHFTEHKCKFRGPFTPAQLEVQWAEQRKQAAEATGAPNGQTQGWEDTDFGKAWNELKAKYRDGDQIYYYQATEEVGFGQTWGYALFREGKVLAEIMTSMN